MSVLCACEGNVRTTHRAQTSRPHSHPQSFMQWPGLPSRATYQGVEQFSFCFILLSRISSAERSHAIAILSIHLSVIRNLWCCVKTA